MKILFTGGGTAGHINPALAAAGYLKKKHPEVIFENCAGRGLFVEGSATYLTVSTQAIYNIMDFTENPRLAQAGKMFLDIFWIQHGLESLNSVRGGGKTREYIRWSQER